MVLDNVRGRTIYVPIIVPDNGCLCVSYVAGLVASFLFIGALSTTKWTAVSSNVVSMSRPLGMDLRVGMRTMHVDICERNMTGPGYDPNTWYCDSQDVYWSTCGAGNAWCYHAPSTNTVIAALAVAVIGIWASLVIGFRSQLGQALGCMAATFVSSGGVAYFDLAMEDMKLAPFVDYMSHVNGATWSYGSAHHAAVAGALFTALAALTAVVGWWISSRKHDENRIDMRPAGAAVQQADRQ